MKQVTRMAFSLAAGAALTLVPITTIAAPAPTAAAAGGRSRFGTRIYNSARGTAQLLARTSNTLESTNWSGYAAPESGATSVSGSWTVPMVVPSSVPEYSASWVGLDGLAPGDEQLIQAGTGQDTESGATSYFAWWEILPAEETEIPSMVVSPGNQMTASIGEASPGEWTITLDDDTTGAVWSDTLPYTGPGDSAEWVEEAPTVDNVQSDLADFGTVDFTNATVDGSNPDLVSSEAIDLVNSDGLVIAEPSAPSGGNSFTVTDTEGGSAPPASPTVPAAPTGVHATAGRGEAVVSWVPPSSDGGAPVTSYVLTTFAAGAETGQVVVDGTSVTVDQLVDGVAYTFEVAAINSAGTGLTSARSAPVVPATTPGAPRALRVIAGKTLVVLAWKAPSATGGAPITGYTVTLYYRGVKARTVTVGARDLSHELRSLPARSAYRLRVAAKNRVGVGPAVSISAKTT